MDVSGHPRDYSKNLTLDDGLGLESEGREEFAIPRTGGYLYPDFSDVPLTKLSHCAHGTLRLASRHRKEDKDHGQCPSVYHEFTQDHDDAQRKVKFMTEFDALDVVTPELKQKLTPVSGRLKEIEKERYERRKVRRRTKVAQSAAPASAPQTAPMEVEESTPAPSGVSEELEEESIYRARELAELEGLIDGSLKEDHGCSVTGLYELVGELSPLMVSSLSLIYIGRSDRDAQGCSIGCWSLHRIRKEERIPCWQVHRGGFT